MLENLGFVINPFPFLCMQVIDFVGIIVDSTNMRFFLPRRMEEECRLLVSRQVASLSQLSQKRGKLTSCEIAVHQAFIIDNT